MRRERVSNLSGSGQGGGFIEAFDALTGKSKWWWNTIPKPGEPGSETWAGDSWRNGGGPVWVSGSYDPQLNLIYWGTGQPTPDFVGDNREGDNLYTDSIVASTSTRNMECISEYPPRSRLGFDESRVS